MVQNNILAILKKYRVLIILVSAVVAYRMVFSPLFRGYLETKREIEVLEGKLARAIPLLNEEERVDSLYNALAEIMPIEVAAKDIDWQKMSSEVYRTLSSVANKYNVKILNYRPRLEQKKEKVPAQEEDSLNKEKTKGKAQAGSKSKASRTMDMDVDLEAELSDFVRFVYYLENSIQLMEVNEAVLTVGSKRPLSVRLRIKKIIF